jgi:polyhydroxyalkanoate synthase subunit PhaC
MEGTVSSSVDESDAVGEDAPTVDFDGRGLARAIADLAHPRQVLPEALRVASASVRAAFGKQVVDFPGQDRRFADAAWQHNPFYRWWGQSYLAWSEALLRVAESPRLAATSQLRAGYLARILTAAAAPPNVLTGNPAALKRALDTGGASLMRGSRNMARDLVMNGGLPAQVDTRPFRVGQNLACSPGAVVHREEMFEVLQYAPNTREVRSRPLLIVPPQVNKHYILDLAPGRSLIEYIVGQGVHTFCIVWRNPRRNSPEHGRWAVDDYVAAQLRAADIVREITASPDLNVLGVCAGGLTTALMLGHLAAAGDARIHAASFLVAMIGSGSANLITAMAGPRTRRRVARDAQRGVVYSHRALVRNFALMRPADLVYSSAVNNWLLGDDPPAFDILAWNADATNISAALNRDLLDIYAGNRAGRPGSLTVLGTSIDLHRVHCDTFVIAGSTDHITPWRACYATSQLLRGPTEVVVTSTGHIQTIVNPLGKSRASFRHGPAADADSDSWLRNAGQHSGSWWPTWSDWILTRSGDPRPAPDHPGSPAHPAAESAPGLYVLES